MGTNMARSGQAAGPAADATPPPDTRSKARRVVAAAAPVALLLALLFVPAPAGMKPGAWRLVAIFISTVAGLVLQPIPGGALVLCGITLATVLGAITVQQALSGYGDPTVWLVMSAFFISRALIKTGLARRIALYFVRLFGRTSLGVCYALAASDLVLASIIPSNGARSGGVVLPIARSVSELYGSLPGPSAALLGSFLMTAVYQSICVTAAMFFTGQASNPLAAQIAGAQVHYTVTWTSWFVAGIVPGLCSLLVIPQVVFRLNPPAITRTPEAAEFARGELEQMGRMKRGERIMLAVFLGVCGMWMTASLHHVDITVTALIGSCALLISGVLTWEDVKNEKAAWDMFVWYGGLVMLGKALNEGGATRAFADAVASSFGGLGWPLLLGAALPIYFYAHYGFASITAHILAMFPPFLAVLAARGAPLGLVVYGFACFSNLSAGLTNYGTTPTPMFFAQDYVSLKRWWAVGAVISVVNIAIWTTVGFGWWKLIGLW